MGNIKTKKRNRLSIRKTRDCAFIKGELRRQHAKQGTARQGLKRQFGNKEPTPNLSQNNPSRVLQVAKQLIRATDDDSDESNVGEEPTVASLATSGITKVHQSLKGQ